jgi:hypothetical protein
MVLKDLVDLESANRNEATTDADRSIPNGEEANAKTELGTDNTNTTNGSFISCLLGLVCGENREQNIYARRRNRHRAIVRRMSHKNGGIARADVERKEVLFLCKSSKWVLTRVFAARPLDIND